MYVSIDFEDFFHDLKRGLGLWETGPIKIKELWEKYNIINEFLKTYGKNNGKYATFFCTGVLAEKEPQLIKQISKDGHEIACHYFYHDVVQKEDNATLYKMLCKAKESLEKVSDKPVKGFRAPYFLINKNSHEQYKLIEKVFEYDSSFHCRSLRDCEIFKKRMRLKTLKIIPLYSLKVFGRNLKLGGTFLKLFPSAYANIMFQNSLNAGLEPHVYLHPYEFDNATNFKVGFEELLPLGRKKAMYWLFRQNQWLSFRNNTTKGKLISLIKKSELKGTLENIIV